MFDAKDICAAVFVCGMMFEQSFKLEKCDNESACIAQVGDVVVRDGIALIIRPISHPSEQLKFVDNIPISEEKEAEVLKHRLAAYDISKTIFVIANQYYEDLDYTVVDRRSGAKVDVDELPVFSPEGSRFVSMPFMGGPWGKPYDIEIQAVVNGVFQQELAYKNPPEEGNQAWSFVRWDGEKRIVLKVSRWDGTKEITRDAEATLTPRGWEVKVPDVH